MNIRQTWAKSAFIFSETVYLTCFILREILDHFYFRGSQRAGVYGDALAFLFITSFILLLASSAFLYRASRWMALTALITVVFTFVYLLCTPYL